jgi:hypothetical protein
MHAVQLLNDCKMHYQQQMWWCIVYVCYCWQKLRYRLKPVKESIHGCIIRHDIWPPTYFWLNTLWLSFVRHLRDKMYTTNPYNRKELRNIIVRFQQFLEKSSRDQTSCFALVLSSFSKEGNIFNIFCSTCEFLLDFLKVIIIANFFLSSFTDSSETWSMT